MFRKLSAPIIRSTKTVVAASVACHALQHDTHHWLLLQFLVLLMMGAESVRNMYYELAVVNKKQYCPKLQFVGSLYSIDL